MRAFTTLAAASALALEASAMEYTTFGNGFYSGPTTVDDVYITKVTYSTVPPATPCGAHTGTPQEELSFWCGVQPRGDDVENLALIQPIFNWAPNQELTGCKGATADQWCVTASSYSPEGQNGQAYVPVPQGAKVDFEISINATTSMIDQYVYIDGALVSYQADNKGVQPVEFYAENECVGGYECGTLAGYAWTDVTVHLSGADPAYPFTFNGATSSGAKTSDGGKTWTVKEIKVAKDYFYEGGERKECQA
ncbi:uncharacterized protein K452DRAFT_237623 [Aplosporella prunicola CBS 121167]|uniref:Concanavalin A-like lectin/glucanase n=1 Tax=Aplosporella prunicola CBS 121167 TaxID=1176127 RepID=A0A6A6AZD9_9PEZI|nr:uncharacterized protein K452DRAFT_237623 [Aplosporella prunicola CBS 121167]KAF2136374.1 hypothetical protein K452DRAFT_237623 [Aplosporella prunicola CBS 121167]